MGYYKGGRTEMVMTQKALERSLLEISLPEGIRSELIWELSGVSKAEVPVG